jgi:chromosome segregation ATPase
MSKKIVISILVASVFCLQADIEQKLQEVAVKGKLWNEFEHFKKAEEVSGISFTDAQRTEWNTAVANAETVLKQLEESNKKNNNVFVNELNRMNKIKGLDEKLGHILEKAKKEADNSPEYQRLNKEIKAVEAKAAQIRLKAQPYLEKTKAIHEQMDPFMKKIFSLQQEQTRLIDADPDYQKEAKDIAKKYENQENSTPLWFRDMGGLKIKFEKKYADTNAQFKQLADQIKQAQDEVAPLREKIKPEADKIDAIYKEADAESEKTMEFLRKQEKIRNDIEKADAEFQKIQAELRAEMKKTQKKTYESSLREGNKLANEFNSSKEILKKILGQILGPQ